MLQIPELLAPAGDLERLRYAVCYGADAVYCALPEFGMRAAPANFTPEQLAEGVVYAHARGRKVYLTLNTLPTNEEAARMPDAIREAAAAGVDAFIVADLGVLDACKTYAPDVDVHMSTQTGITNYAAAAACYRMGAKRVVLARELSLTDIAVIRDKTPPELELEAFVHGAMCMSVSGRCLLSNYLAGRDANRGQCAQPCRWKYYLSEETRPGQLFEIGEGEGGSYILNANDLCTAPFLDLICKAGVDSLKIEGRAKTFYYVASVTAAYRQALDQYLADPFAEDFDLPDGVLDELTRTSHRPYSPGFHLHRRLHPGMGVRGHGGPLGERRGLLPAAGQVVSGGHAGSPDPQRGLHPAGPRLDQKQRRGDGGLHPSRDGKLHHPHPGTAPHEPAAQKELNGPLRPCGPPPPHAWEVGLIGCVSLSRVRERWHRTRKRTVTERAKHRSPRTSWQWSGYPGRSAV